MQLKILQAIAVAVVGLILLGPLGRAQAGETVFCCVCDCRTSITCTMDIDPADCRSFCGGTGMNGTACEARVSSSPCSAVAECHEAVGAPALGAHGLTAVAVLLASVGALGLRRAARRRRG